MIKAVIFDLDDTLIPEVEYVKSGFQAIAQYMEKKYHFSSQEIYQTLNQLFQTNSKNVFNQLLDKKEISYTTNTIQELVSIYRSHEPNIAFYDDVIPTLKKLKQKHIKTGIITDGYTETQKLKLQVLNTYSLFDEIIITDILGKEYWKPHPKSFEIMRERLDVEFNEMMYVGDNPEKDFYIGSIYPITCVRIFRNQGVYNGNDYFKEVMEKFRIKHLEEIYEYINCSNAAN